MRLNINGRAEMVSGSITIEGLIEERGLAPKRVVIEYNGIVITRERWSEIQIREGDIFEIISFVGGG